MSESPLKSARFAAITILCKLERTAVPVSHLFDEVFPECGLSGTDRHLAVNLIYGVLRQRQYLDNCLAVFCRQPIRKLHPFVHQALAVGLYQILFLDRIPESAAVNETIKAMKVVHLASNLQGFVNGVLRTIIREKHRIPVCNSPDKDGIPVLNHPAWLTERWERNFGRQEMVRICSCNNLRPVLILRVNPLVISREDLLAKLKQEGVLAKPGVHAPYAIILPDFRGPIQEIPGFSQGAFQVQDESAQLTGLLLGPFAKHSRFLDGCAGLGGKTGHLIELTAGFCATVTAVEPDKRRFLLLRENLARLHPQRQVELHSCDLIDFSRQTNDRFDGILIDAPCSGTGVIRRHPDIRWNRKSFNLPEFAKKQRQLLDVASTLLTPGGTLVYATCSIEPEENQEVVTDFLRAHPLFRLTDIRSFLPPSAEKFVKNGFFQPQPTEETDGFFAARLSFDRK